MPASRLAVAVEPNPARPGAPVTLSLVLDGRLADAWVGIDGVDVTVERKTGGAWEALDTVTTDSLGEAEVVGLVADRVTTYRATYDGRHGGANGVFDGAAPTVVHEVVRSVGGRKSKAGKGKLKISGEVSPAYAGGTVLLQKQVGKGGWKKHKKTRANSASAWSFKVDGKPDTTTRYRAVVKASGAFAASYGTTIKVKGR